MSGKPSCASELPSTKSTIACTSDCGCTSTRILAGASANRWWASMTSSPLFISVAESTEIFGPIDHFGWAIACAGVTSASSARFRPRNGPPDAVRVIRETAEGSSQPAMHWNTALCSLSIGTMVAPAAWAACMSSSPASTSDSLLASNRRLPACAAASVDDSPAAPTIAATTLSQASPAASASNAASPACAWVSSPASRSPSRNAAKPAASAITAWSGRCVRHSATSASTLLPAASTLARICPGWRAITSSAEAPIEPVAPNTATRCMDQLRPIRSPATSCPARTPARPPARCPPDPARHRGRESRGRNPWPRRGA